METVVDPGIYLAIGMLAIVLGMTSYGVYIGFGPPSRRLEDPFDNHHHGEGVTATATATATAIATAIATNQQRKILES